MFALRRIVRSNLNLKNPIYTSSTLKCDNSKETKPGESKPKQENNNIKNEKKEKFATNNERKQKLIAEVKVKDYANFKSKKQQPKVELYSNTTTQEEKLEAKKNLEKLSKEIESEPSVCISENEKFQTLTIPQPKPKERVKKDLDEKLVNSARTVASKLGGDVKKTESDILGYLKALELKAEKRKFKQNDSNGLPEGEERQVPSKDKSRQFRGNERGLGRDRWMQRENRQDQLDFHVRKEDNQGYMHGDRLDQTMAKDRQHDHRERRQFEPQLLHILRERHFGYKGSEFFKSSDFTKESPKLTTWDELEKLELKVLSMVPPRNYFEELVQWTEEGKLWHFPIDNDQGNELEANIDFSEHVFLEEYLEPWCPKRGPLRHFMELVLTGLSKNYHFTVEEKKEHILWYRDYFEGKKKLLQEMGALEGAKVLKEPVEKSENTP